MILTPLLRKLATLPPFGRKKPVPVKLSRHEYKAQWNSVSLLEDNAKFAVSGYLDESLYAETAEGTKSMLQQLVGIKPTDVVLEIGAGVGRSGAALAPICKEWIGTDVSENMIGHLTRRLAHLPNVRAVATSGFDLKEIESESVDVVYCTVVFMHLEEWERFSYVSEGWRILRPGGRMLVDNVNILSDAGWKFFRGASRGRAARTARADQQDVDAAGAGDLLQARRLCRHRAALDGPLDHHQRDQADPAADAGLPAVLNAPPSRTRPQERRAKTQKHGPFWWSGCSCAVRMSV